MHAIPLSEGCKSSGIAKFWRFYFLLNVRHERFLHTPQHRALARALPTVTDYRDILDAHLARALMSSVASVCACVNTTAAKGCCHDIRMGFLGKRFCFLGVLDEIFGCETTTCARRALLYIAG